MKSLRREELIKRLTKSLPDASNRELLLECYAELTRKCYPQKVDIQGWICPETHEVIIPSPRTERFCPRCSGEINQNAVEIEEMNNK